jgi:succinate dehydrogenase / fumarate reductase cytochrome b subunit
MHALKKYLSSSIGRKQLMGLTGMAWYGFLLAHLVGNLGMLGGAERFNQYGYLLLHTLAELIIPAEIALVLTLIAHIYLAITLSIENKKARPVAYEVKKGGKSKHTYMMMMTGTAILLFIVIHIAHFRFAGAGMGNVMPTVTYDGVTMSDLYANMLRAFSHWWYMAGYLVVFTLIFSHLAHGFQSSFQSLGFNHPKWTPLVKLGGLAYAGVICGGFAFLAVWAYLQHGGTP